MKKAVIALLMLCTPMGATMAEPANLIHDYIDAEFGIGKLTVKDRGNQFDFKTRTLTLNGSKLLSDNMVASFNVSKTSGKDNDNDGPAVMHLDARDTSYTGMIGAVLPFGESSDLLMQVGLSHTRQDNSFRFGRLPAPLGSLVKTSPSDTAVAWSVGTKTYFPSMAFELELTAAGTKDQTSFAIGGPTYLTPNLGLNLSWNYTRDKIAAIRSIHSSFNIGIRYQF